MPIARILSPTLAVSLALCLSGCAGKDDPAGEESIASDSLLAAAQAITGETGGQPVTAQASLPQPDPARPLASYPELKSGQQVMFLYAAASRLPPDFEKMAEAYSSEYRSTSDAFRKNDLMKAIKPQIEQEIAAAVAQPYAWVELDDTDLESYDFGRKGFSVGEFSSDHHRYFRDVYTYSYSWANRGAVVFMPVADETLAREIEAMRTQWNNKPRLKVFFFAQSADLNNQRVNAVVTRVQVTDRKGRVLAEYGTQ